MRKLHIIVIILFLINCSITNNNWKEYNKIRVLLFSDKTIVDINQEVTFYFKVNNTSDEIISLPELNENSLMFNDIKGNHFALGVNQARINKIISLQPGKSLIYSFKYRFKKYGIFDTYINYFYPAAIDIQPTMETRKSFNYKSNILRLEVKEN